MIEEGLVILACVTSKGCSQTSSLYFNRHPEFQQIVDYNTKRVKNITDPIEDKVIKTLTPIEEKIVKSLNPTFVQVAGPALVLVTGGTSTIGLNKNFSLQLNSSQVLLTFKKEF